MIPNTDLRVGNIVMNEECFHTIKWNDLGFKQTHFNPIELSPEILERAGFVSKEEYGIMQYKLTIPNIIAPSGNNLYELLGMRVIGSLQPVEVSYTVNGFWAAINIQYLHQLQNLYHALTHTELEINLT